MANTRSGEKRPNCRWVAEVRVDERYTVTFTVSDNQMQNWRERPRKPSTTNNFCHMTRAALERQLDIKRDSVHPDEIRLVSFKPRDPHSQSAINVAVPVTELVKSKPEAKKLPKKVGEGQLSFLATDEENSK